jgi:ribonuclease HI
MVFYAVANGRTTGIFLNWNECKTSINCYKNASYKKFDTKEEAEYFITSTNNKNPDKLDDTDYYVYTDGACSNNGTDYAISGIGIFFGINDSRNVSKKIEGKQTNNTAELSAIIEVYSIIKNDIVNGKKITIVSDSEYAIKCATLYGEKCYNNNFNDIPNKELVKDIYELYKNISNITFKHVKAHTNNLDVHSIGNKNADKLANLAIGLNNCPYETQISSKKNYNSIDNEIVEMKREITDLKYIIYELVDMMKAVY